MCYFIDTLNNKKGRQGAPSARVGREGPVQPTPWAPIPPHPLPPQSRRPCRVGSSQNLSCRAVQQSQGCSDAGFPRDHWARHSDVLAPGTAPAMDGWIDEKTNGWIEEQVDGRNIQGHTSERGAGPPGLASVPLQLTSWDLGGAPVGSGCRRLDVLGCAQLS